MERDSMTVSIRRTGASLWDVVFCLVTRDVTIDGTLEMRMKPGCELTQQEAEDYMWRNRDKILRWANQQKMCVNRMAGQVPIASGYGRLHLLVIPERQKRELALVPGTLCIRSSNLPTSRIAPEDRARSSRL